MCLFSLFLSDPGEVPGWFPLSRHRRQEPVKTLSRRPAKGPLWPCLAPSMAEKSQGNILSWGNGIKLLSNRQLPQS